MSRPVVTRVERRRGAVGSGSSCCRPLSRLRPVPHSKPWSVCGCGAQKFYPRLKRHAFPPTVGPVQPPQSRSDDGDRRGLGFQRFGFPLAGEEGRDAGRRRGAASLRRPIAFGLLTVGAVVAGLATWEVVSALDVATHLSGMSRAQRIAHKDHSQPPLARFPRRYVLRKNECHWSRVCGLVASPGASSACH